jgi:hypothetical protein
MHLPQIKETYKAMMQIEGSMVIETCTSALRI